MKTTEVPATNITSSNETEYAIDVLVLSATSCSLSVLGGVVIIASFILLPEIRNFTRRLVVCLTVADLITASAYLVSVVRYVNVRYGHVNLNEENILCKVQSFFTTYSSLVSFFLTSFIAVYIFDTVVTRRDRLGSTLWLVIFNVISWIIPACLVASAVIKDVLGSDETRTGGTGPWCWISTDAKHQLMWMLITGKGWEMACYIITMSLYILLKVHLILHYRRAQFHFIHDSLRDEDRNFLYVWFLLYVLRVWGTLRFFLYVIAKPSHEEWYMKALLRLQALGDPGQAFCNFFLFCLLDKTVFTKLKRTIFCRGRENPERSRLLLPENTENSKQLTPDPFTLNGDDETDIQHSTSRENVDGDYVGYASMAATRSVQYRKDSPDSTAQQHAESC